jgi:hypothetical protein
LRQCSEENGGINVQEHQLNLRVSDGRRNILVHGREALKQRRKKPQEPIDRRQRVYYAVKPRPGMTLIPGTAKIVDLDSFLTRGGLSVQDVEKRVMRACKTVRVLPDNEWRFLRNGAPKSAAIPVIQDFMDAYDPDGKVHVRFRPTPFDVSDMLVALKWCNVLTKEDFKYLWWRSFDEVSFSMIGARIGKSDETARARYRDALLRVWNQASIRNS